GCPGCRFRKVGTDVIARLRARFDQPGVFQAAIGLHDRVDADPHLPAQGPYGWYPLAGAVGAVPDHSADPVGDLFIQQHGALPTYSVTLVYRLTLPQSFM